ncbi:hypothetical protein A2686_01945 [Candidatus Woesebacteria bacterium RIFCSPHIGHO2_01_FULL_38_10]|uniref:Uncharacterized protein n=1 Tax=Candidatus Woesebacteria bacterium RIFCSPLOWO2_01_FULL_39_10b TaxID=1802517 RepID=A0A1F8B9M2_9BACT|nr:MAG: hypothetical protein A2686_01945 [Candidatus Woesebacteria bacterium RIFCSPHIGHO2_01_FULL_38_10]OGM60741.1 MAG: hypothetical protein A2892_01715 [Candidatus Woesebacteria bacterium RIFCSPLOWO2_01_FULL_39_10b]
MLRKKKKKSQKNNFDLIYFVLVIPFFMIFAVLALLFLNKLAKNNRYICKYLGNIWLEGSPNDETIRRGCFSYQKLYE